jgi:hypothetical protein
MSHSFQTLRDATSAYMRRHWPLALVLIFFVAVLLGMRQKSKAAIAPPYADALQYYCKSSFVWEDIKAGKFGKIMESPPAMRPPGTALLLYPFGFRQKISSFLFRSQFAPFLIWMASLLLVVWPLCQTSRHRLTASAVVCCLGTLPMFFQFELNPEGFSHFAAIQCWGMVDTLLASVGALSAGLIVNSARTRNLWLASAGWLAGAFSILIKPSGILIMASVIGVFIVEIMALSCTVAPAGNLQGKPRLSTMTFTASALGIGGMIYSIVLWVCFQSAYLGKETRELFSAALAVSHQMYPMDLLKQFMGFARCVLGWPITMALLVAAGFMSLRLFAETRRTWLNPSLLRFSGMLILFAASLAWWWIGPGTIPRYYFPFVTLLIIWMLPDMFRQLLMGTSTRIVRCARLYLFLPPLLLMCLFLPPVSAQRMLGVNLSVGLRSEEMKAGDFLIDAAEKAGKSFKVYFLDGIATELPHHQDYIKWIHSKPRGMLIWPVRANEWAGDPGLNIERILECNYIVFEGDFPDSKSPLRRVVANYNDEIDEFARFVSGLGSEQGVTLRRFGQLSVVELQDRTLFEKAFRAWAQKIDWQTNFARRNRTEN